ncbi:hypothetical protein LCGC14_2387800, partial [marine sediment metagenome]
MALFDDAPQTGEPAQRATPDDALRRFRRVEQRQQPTRRRPVKFGSRFESPTQKERWNQRLFQADIRRRAQSAIEQARKQLPSRLGRLREAGISPEMRAEREKTVRALDPLTRARAALIKEGAKPWQADIQIQGALEFLRLREKELDKRAAMFGQRPAEGTPSYIQAERNAAAQIDKATLNMLEMASPQPGQFTRVLGRSIKGIESVALGLEGGINELLASKGLGVDVPGVYEGKPEQIEIRKLIESPIREEDLETIGKIPIAGPALEREIDALTTPIGMATILAFPVFVAAGAVGGVAAATGAKELGADETTQIAVQIAANILTPGAGVVPAKVAARVPKTLVRSVLESPGFRQGIRSLNRTI